MTWIFIATAAYLFLALSNFGNKYLLKSRLPNPGLYTFSVGLLSGLVMILLLFGVVSFPSSRVLGLALGSGFLRMVALYTFFSALKRSELTRIVPAVDGAQPLVIALLTAIFVTGGLVLDITGMVALALLMIGTVLVSIERRLAVTLSSLGFALSAALLFAASFFLSKFVYQEQEFLSGFFWISLGFFLSSFFLVVLPSVRGQLRVSKGGAGKFSLSMGAVFLLTQGCGAAATALQNFSIDLVPQGDLAFVQALAGLQYVFLFLFVVLTTLFVPHLLRERLTRQAVLQKAAGIVVLAAGIAFLAL